MPEPSSIDLSDRLAPFIGVPVRMQFIVSQNRAVQMFDTVIDHITDLDDGGMIAYDGGVLHLSGAELKIMPTMLVFRDLDRQWSLTIVRRADLPEEIKPFPRVENHSDRSNP